MVLSSRLTWWNMDSSVVSHTSTLLSVYFPIKISWIPCEVTSKIGYTCSFNHCAIELTRIAGITLVIALMLFHHTMQNWPISLCERNYSFISITEVGHLQLKTGELREPRHHQWSYQKLPTYSAHIVVIELESVRSHAKIVSMYKISLG